MCFRSAVVLLVLACTAPVAAQRRVEDQGQTAVDQWIQKSYEATERYRSGDLNAALALLGTMTREEQEKAVKAIRGQVERIAAGWPPREEDVVPWPANVLRALGALHMEAAIAASASKDRDASDTAAHHIDLAKSVFALVFIVVKDEERSLERWLLVLALEHMANAEFRRAFDILEPACKEHDDYAPLLLACGTLHETYASFPFEHGLPRSIEDLRAAFNPTLSATMRTLMGARAARREQLALARKYLERATTLDANDSEAPLRLANVRAQQGNEDEAARMLEALVGRARLNERESYLARLFLARVRTRQNRLEDAAAILAKAPPTQSALIARADNAIRRGNTKEATTLADRASRSELDDPWWGYRYGQYWVPDDLYKQLRAEARK